MTELDFSSVQDRLPPQSIEAEEAVLGGIMLDPEAMSRISDRLTADAFYIQAHKDIYQAAQRLYSQDKPTDLLSISNWLTDNGLLFRIGGRNKLATLFDRTVSSVNIDAFANLVLEKYQRRQLIKAANEIIKLASETQTEFPTILDEVEQKIFTITSESNKSELRHISHSLAEVFTEIEAHHNGTARPAFSTGFYDLDNLLGGGFHPKRLYVFAARPGVGKSALAGNLARNIAQLSRLPVAIFSLEMSEKEYSRRSLSSESGIENSYLQSGKIGNNQWQPLSQAVGQLTELPIFLNEESCPSLNQVRSQIRRLSSQYGGVGLVIVDYLQLMADSISSKENMTQRVGTISRGLKRLSKDLNVPVLALAQLNREVESRNDKRPLLSDLRECLTRNAYLTLADTGEQISIADVKVGTKILAVNARQKVVSAAVGQVWAKGVKPVYQVTTQCGRIIECTDNHPILTQRGYVALKDLRTSDLVATAYRVPLQHQTDKRLNDPELQMWSDSDLLWESIRHVEYIGQHETFDICVPETGNFLANGVVVHNSGQVEQDSDCVIMLYRDELYNPDTPDRGITELIFRKQRNGPTGTVKLLFDHQFAKFKNLSHGRGF